MAGKLPYPEYYVGRSLGDDHEYGIGWKNIFIVVDEGIEHSHEPDYIEYGISVLFLI